MSSIDFLHAVNFLEDVGLLVRAGLCPLGSLSSSRFPGRVEILYDAELLGCGKGFLSLLTPSQTLWGDVCLRLQEEVGLSLSLRPG